MPEALTRKMLKKLSDCLYEIPKSTRADMRVPARIFVSRLLLDKVLTDRSLWQIMNVATLPGIQSYAIAMADIHEGYGFPIGGVAAMAIHENGVISPGGIGYDINCGVRLLTSDVFLHEAKPYLEKLADALFLAVPSGVGKTGRVALKPNALDKVLKGGAKKALSLGFGSIDDLVNCEEGGSFSDADPAFVSKKAKERGGNQLGTLGSGNHFLEVQVVDEIYDSDTAMA